MPDCRVMIVGMKSEAAKKFNGTFGTVHDYKEDMGRWRVEADMDGELK